MSRPVFLSQKSETRVISVQSKSFFFFLTKTNSSVSSVLIKENLYLFIKESDVQVVVDYRIVYKQN